MNTRIDRPGYATIVAVLLLIAALAYAPTWAVIVLAVLAVAAVVTDVLRWRQNRVAAGRDQS